MYFTLCVNFVLFFSSFSKREHFVPEGRKVHAIYFMSKSKRGSQGFRFSLFVVLREFCNCYPGAINPVFNGLPVSAFLGFDKPWTYTVFVHREAARNILTHTHIECVSLSFFLRKVVLAQGVSQAVSFSRFSVVHLIT